MDERMVYFKMLTPIVICGGRGKQENAHLVQLIPRTTAELRDVNRPNCRQCMMILAMLKLHVY
jgi:hypothetical protein